MNRASNILGDILGCVFFLATILGLARPLFGEWVDVPEVRSAGNRRGIFRDIVAAVPKIIPGIGDSDRTYGSDLGPADRTDPTNLVTATHEYTHALNSVIRNRSRGTGRVNACYMPGGRALLLPEPAGVTLDEVRRKMTGLRRFNLSSGQIQYWNRQPLYLLDELSAYTCGTVAAMEHGLHERAKDSLTRAEDVLEHCVVMARLARQRGYQHADELDDFLAQTGGYIEGLYRELLTPEASP